jgi:hypothetical protein
MVEASGVTVTVPIATRENKKRRSTTSTTGWLKAELIIDKHNVGVKGFETFWTQSQLLQAGDHPDCCQYGTR